MTLMNLELASWKPEIDTFLDFKTRCVKKVEKLDLFDRKNPDFEGFFKKIIDTLGLTFEDDEHGFQVSKEDPDRERLLDFIEAVIGATSLFQQYHELFVRVPDFVLKLQVNNRWVRLGLEYLIFVVSSPLLQRLDVQEKYYLLLPTLERVLKTAEQDGNIPLAIEQKILLIQIFKNYISILQKNKYMDDVEDLFALAVQYLSLFDQDGWKNPLLDNFHRMVVQVGLMLRRDDEVRSIVDHRLLYLDQIKKHLIHEEQDPNTVLDVINVNFSISKNFLQLNDTKNHETYLAMAENWLEQLMDSFSFSKRAWKLKAKMIRSAGHNALKRGAYTECYRMYLKAFVLSYAHKLPKENARAMMYITKYHKFFIHEHLPSLKEDLGQIDEILNKTHLLYLLGKNFASKKQYKLAMYVQELMVDVLEEGLEREELTLAVSAPSAEMLEHHAKVKELYGKNLDYLGNLRVKFRNIDGAIEVFKKEAELFQEDNPRKAVKVYMKMAKELRKSNRFKEAVEYGERAFHLASANNISENLEKILTFLVETTKIADMPEQLANYKNILYGLGE